MRDEWRYVVGTDDCYVNLDGEVQQNGHILEPFKKDQSGDHKWVTTTVGRHKWDYETRTFVSGEEDQLVWQLMKEAWFYNWPTQSSLHFVNGDPWDCSADNIRAWSRDQNRLILVREDEWGFNFDKRLRGRVEIVELDERFAGPSEAAARIGGTRSGVSRMLSGELETHHGFHFRWV